VKLAGRKGLLLPLGFLCAQARASPEQERAQQQTDGSHSCHSSLCPSEKCKPTRVACRGQFRSDLVCVLTSLLRDNPDRSISVGELCLETGVPKRTLMLSFQKAFGISPLAYHRRLRLNRARRELFRSSTRDVTVAQVAFRWGFDHFGRFSVDYHNLFGETPTTTLRS
jgi:transcriptional regulator GlxA family with amidase domain